SGGGKSGSSTRSWHCSTGDKEHVGSNGRSIGARSKEIRTLQDRRKYT
ncbi:hypothetical protein LINPERHAP2_LOCUS10548, partial [Linum perenne]